MRRLVDPHSAEITFVHPVTLETMTLTAPLPPDIVGLMDRLRSVQLKA